MPLSEDSTLETKAPILRVKGIKKRFGSFEALHRIDATIFPGRISAFVGPNGAGKTTLFHILTGNLQPDEGKVTLNDREVTDLLPWKIARSGVGKLFQDVRVFENMSVLDNVCVALMDVREQTLLASVRMFRNQRLRREYQTEAMQWLEYVGLEDQADQWGGRLSFGQQKLLSIARLIARGATCLLLDEPTAALSPKMTESMVKLIQRLVSERQLSVALIEHNMSVVKDLAFYIYFMHEGSVYCHGTQHCVLENPEVRELYMGLSGTIR